MDITDIIEQRLAYTSFRGYYIISNTIHGIHCYEGHNLGIKYHTWCTDGISDTAHKHEQVTSHFRLNSWYWLIWDRAYLLTTQTYHIMTNISLNFFMRTNMNIIIHISINIGIRINFNININSMCRNIILTYEIRACTATCSAWMDASICKHIHHHHQHHLILQSGNIIRMHPTHSELGW